MSSEYAHDPIHQLPETITYDQVVQALAAVAPDLEPRNVRELFISPTQVDITTWHADAPHERTRSYRINHVQGSATEGSDR